MGGHDFLDEVLECERHLALAEGENALLRSIVLKLFRGTPSLDDEDRRLVTRLMTDEPGKL
jgi:hypothetical protein